MSGVDLGNLIQILKRGFPILPGMVAGDPKEELEQFYAQNIGLIKVVCDPLPMWAQGDILDPIPFISISQDGGVKNFTAPGMLMTSTCDLDRKENVVFCPCIVSKKLKGLASYQDVLKNEIYEFFFVGKASTGEELVVNLSHPMTLPRERVVEKLESKSIVRLNSLTHIGWYLFITKFSINYLRPDDPSTMNMR